MLLLLFGLVFIIIYLSYFGIETDKFDSIIKTKANEAYKYAKLDFKKTKIHLNPKELNLVVKLQNPKIFIKNNEVILSKIDLFLPLKSFISSDFLLKRAEIALFRNDIKDFVDQNYNHDDLIELYRKTFLLTKDETPAEFLLKKESVN